MNNPTKQELVRFAGASINSDTDIEVIIHDLMHLNKLPGVSITFRKGDRITSQLYPSWSKAFQGLATIQHIIDMALD